jgi:hypothetical protein
MMTKMSALSHSFSIWASQKERWVFMITFEDVTRIFLRAADTTGITTHPDTWLNPETLDRDFECILHLGPCEEAEHRATCSVSFTWSPLDTALALEGPQGVCEFFHEPNETCPHLQTEEVPPLALDLAYMVSFQNVPLEEVELQPLVRMLRFRASENSSRAIETRPNVNVVFGETGLEVESLTLQQHVELPLWNPESLTAFREFIERQRGSSHHGRGRRRYHFDDDDEADPTHQEEWMPPLLEEVVADIERVLTALDDLSQAPFTHHTNN